jgi:hypothetical protein
MQNSSNNFCSLVSGGNVQFDLLASELKTSAQQSDFRSHPLGFFRMRIGTVRGGPTYLHVWLPERSETQAPHLTIHAHSVTIASYIVMGEIEDYRYTWTDDLTGSQRLFAQNRGLGGPPLLRTDRVGFASLASSSRFRATDRYIVPYPDFHESRAGSSGLTATICNFVGESNNDPLVVAPADLDRVEDYKVVVLDEGKKAEVMRQVLDAIKMIGKP